MGQALYRKYRSKSLSEIVGQEHITDTLDRALKSGRISHAYLFSGPRGVGKTSIARILAHEINGLPYTDDSTHMDIIEIDAASNNSVEDVRDLREKVYVAPSSAKYKVYIIDEVHMLSKAAFNALLKTLEEPPAHVVFILATTVANKLPDTIISRTQHYTFKPVEQKKVIDHLRFIATTEGVKIDDDALALLAAHGEGSFRDSISLLDQARGISSLGDKAATISAAEVQQLLGIAPDEAVKALINTIGTASQTAGVGVLLGQVGALYEQGIQAAAIASQLAEKLRTALSKNKPLLPIGQSLSLMKELIEVPASRNPERLLEIVLMESADISSTPVETARPAATIQAAAVSTPVATIAAPRLVVQAIDDVLPTPVAAQPKASQPVPVSPTTEIAPAVAAAKPAHTGPTVALDAAQWPLVLNSIKKEYNTLYGVLRMANPIFNEDSLELQFKFLFHQKRLNEVKNKKIIADFIQQITGNDIAVICTYNKDATPGATVAAASLAAAPAPAGAIDAISDIFGGGVVL